MVIFVPLSWGFGVEDLGFWGFRVGKEVHLVVDGLRLRGQSWIGLAQMVGNTL